MTVLKTIKNYDETKAYSKGVGRMDARLPYGSIATPAPAAKATGQQYKNG